MAVSNFPPNTQRRIQGRNWTLSGNQPGGGSTTIGDLAEVYASDLITITNSYNNGVGTNVQQGQNIGFLIEKVAASPPSSDPALFDTRYNLEVTDVLSTEYEYTETEFINIYNNLPGSSFKLPKTGGSPATLSFNGARNFADSYINGDPVPYINGNPIPGFSQIFGSYRVVSYARDFGGTDLQTVATDTFELRALAITNLKRSREYIEVDGVHNTIKLTGDISVYPNQNDNGTAGWLPAGDIQYRIVVKQDALDSSLWKTVDVTVPFAELEDPDAPGNEGVIFSFDYVWDGKMQDGKYYFGEFDFEVQAIAPVSGSPTRNTISPRASTAFMCKKCQSLLFMAMLSELISIMDGMEVPLNMSSLESANEPGSMGYGWFSTENIKIFDISETLDGSDLVYCDETGMTRRWVHDGTKYVPILPDNTMTISYNPSGGNATYVVKWRDNFQREFNRDVEGVGRLRREVDRNGRVKTYTKDTSYLLIEDDKGRKIYQHFDPGKPQPKVINDNIDPDLGRRYVLEYWMDGTEQKQLRSITDPVGDKTVFFYDGNGRVSERREELDNHHRSIFYTYAASNTGQLATMKATSTLLVPGPDPDIVTELFQTSYTYKVPFSYGGETYVTTKVVTEDLMDPSNPERISYTAQDGLSRVIGEFEYVEDDDNGDPVYIATLNEYNDPSDPSSDSDDPWLLTRSFQVNKESETILKYTERGNVKEVLNRGISDPLGTGDKTILFYPEEDSLHPLHNLFPDKVIAVQRPAYDRDDPIATTYPTTKFTYNHDAINNTSNGNLEIVEDALGRLTRLRYNASGLVERVVNRRGFKTYLEYDLKARLSRVFVQKGTAPTPLTPDDDYDGVDAEDFRKIELGYDAYDNLESVIDANGITLGVEYDNVDRPTKLTDGNTQEIVFEYLNRVLDHVELPDSSGTLGGHTGRVSRVSYDSAGRTLSVSREDSSNPSEMRVGFTYDGLSQLRSLIRTKNNVDRSHTAEYDRQGRTIKTMDAKNSDPGVVDPKFNTAAYAPFCKEYATTSARGVRTRAQFDRMCQLTSIVVGDPDLTDTHNLEVVNVRETRDFKYDHLGRLLKTSQTAATGSIYGQAVFGSNTYGSSGGLAEEREYQYNALDQVTKVIFEDDKEIEYEYNEEGSVTKVTENASGTPKVTEFSYYGDNRLHQVTYVRSSGGNQVFTYTYDAGGRPLTLAYPSSTGIVAHFNSAPNLVDGWDGNGQLKHLRYIKGASTLIRRFQFEYDDSGNRTEQLDVTSTKATRWVYGYDWLDRLESVKKATAANLGALGALQLVAMYEYDAADNRYLFEVPNLSDPLLTETFRYSYDNADSITQIERKEGSGPYSVIETFTSDDDGNLLSRTDVSTGVVTEYKWTDFNRLASIETKLSGTPTGTIKQGHTFDLSGFRRKKKDKDDAETTEYAAGLSTEVTKVTSGETITYLKGGGGIMGFERSSDGAMFYFITDTLSTVRDVVRGTDGAVMASYEFDEYGRRLPPSMTNTVESQKTFVGGMSVQDEVADTGLMMMGHRFYAPDLGRFLNRDPIGFRGGLNLFEYASSSPISILDPSGLAPWAPFGWDERGFWKLGGGLAPGQGYRAYGTKTIVYFETGEVRNFPSGAATDATVSTLGFFNPTFGAIDTFASDDFGPEDMFEILPLLKWFRKADTARDVCKVKDLKPLHSKELVESSSGFGKIRGLSDDELLKAVKNPRNDDFLTVNKRTGNLVDGNTRAYELQRRAESATSAITPETEIPIRFHIPDFF